jgi:hypothetical protein
MDHDTQTPADAAQRLEAALNRIAHLATRRALPASGGRPAGSGDPALPALVGARLDTIIAGLRTALAGKQPDATD